MGLSSPAFGFELPAGLPAREEGLWAIDQTGTISDDGTALEIQKVWNICLDASADRALHELEVREQQASVASLNETCDEPAVERSGETVSWTMHCSGPSPADGRIRRTDIQHRTTFVTGEETHAETIIANRDDPSRGKGRFVTDMKRLGACQGTLQPGGMMLIHWRADGEETLKARQIRNIYDEIANHKAFTASRLGR